jgi:protocatechuate 3,4-dioxygenase beta subunit
LTVHHSKRLSRRAILGRFAAVGAAVAAGCGSSSPTSPSTNQAGTGSTSGAGTTTGSCVATPSETSGPYPDRLGMLGNTAFFRRDITEGRPGIPLTLTLTIVNTASSCSAVAGANVEIWQCDASGHYSEYAQPGYDGTGQTFLRGVQTTDAIGQVTFATVYPGWYAGRATHIHVEVYVNGRSVKVTQIAFPEDVTAQVYASGVYASNGENPTHNAGDMVFADGTSDELATISGSPSSGYTAMLTIGVTS